MANWRQPRLRPVCLVALLVGVAWLGVPAAPFTRAQGQPASQPPVREIFVPFSDLEVILQGDNNRVFLTREQYEQLVRDAREQPREAAPQSLVLLSAQYEGQLEDGRAVLRGKLELEVLEDGLFALPLPLTGVGIREAQLDDQPAPLLKHAQGVQLLVGGRGRHQFQIELTAPLRTTAAQQVLQVTLPTNAATQLKLTVPGNVDVKGGAAVIHRQFEASRNQTIMELLPSQGELTIVMSLNNRQLQSNRITVARSVIVDEITQGYERIHATISARVLHGATDEFRFQLPAAFEVTRIETPLMARWQETAAENGQKTVEVKLREPTNEPFVLYVTANRSPNSDSQWLAGLAQWEFPQLQPLDVAGHVAVVGVLLEDRLEIQELAPTNLISIDSAVLVAALPASVFEAEPGAPRVRQIATYYTPDGQFQLASSFDLPPTQLNVVSNQLLVISDEGLLLRGGFSLSPVAEPLFEFSFVLPDDWDVTAVTQPDGSALPFERYQDDSSPGSRVLVRLKQGVAVGSTTTINYQARTTPDTWLSEWTTQTVALPHVPVVGATSSSGVVAAQLLDDLSARPNALQGLTPLLDNEKSQFGLADYATAVAFRFETPDYQGELLIDRTVPTVAAQVYSFFEIGPDNLSTHCEFHFDVRNARTRQLAFSLPLDSPEEIRVNGLGGVSVKEFSSQDETDRRVWTVQLANRHSGRVALALEFETKINTDAEVRLTLPLPSAEGVVYQSGMVAVEGDPELDSEINTTARAVDVGELAAADHPVGRRLIGSYGFLGPPTALNVTVRRRTPFGLPPALIQRAEMVSVVSAAGRIQTVARYQLQTKATLFEIKLPPGSSLWSILIDQQPLKPQRQNDQLLISLASAGNGSVRDLQIVFESPATTIGMSGTVDMQAPQLMVRVNNSQESRTIPQADLQWEVLLPSGFVIRGTDGSVYLPPRPRPRLALWKALTVIRSLWAVANEQIESSFEPAAVTGGMDVESATPMYEGEGDYAGSDADESEEAMPHAAKSAGGRDRAAGEPSEVAPSQPEEPPVNAPQPATTADDSAPQSQRDLGTVRGKKYWALEGVSSLPIELQVLETPTYQFKSLGEQPRLVVHAVDQRRITILAYGLALLAAVWGLSLTKSTAQNKAGCIVLLWLAAVLPVMVTERLDVFIPIFDGWFYVGCLLLLWYSLVALLRPFLQGASRLGGRLARESVTSNGAWVLAIGVSLAAAPTFAQEMPNTALNPADLPPELSELLPWLEQWKRPVTVPADAIIVPYDPNDAAEIRPDQQVLVPYAHYEELWNRAHPLQPLSPQKLPAPWAIAGIHYRGTLGNDEFLRLTGTMDVDVFTEEATSLPLALEGGVLESVQVDGQPAKLQWIAPANPAPNQPPANQQARAADPPKLLLLHLRGKGRRRVELSIRMGLIKQGGWKQVNGTLPHGPAASLTFQVPARGTEIRQSSLPDRETFETTTANTTIESALAANGRLDVRWRPQVSEGQLDQALTVNSTTLFDIREDALRLVWQMELDFGRAMRDNFTVNAPAAYLLEQVSGDNVRGWTFKPTGDTQRIDISLLTPVVGKAKFTLHLARRGRVGRTPLDQFSVPSLRVSGAALEQGTISVRRSPRLEIKTISFSEIRRDDRSSAADSLAQMADGVDAPVLLVTPFQSFRYIKPGYELMLRAELAQPQPRAITQLALRIAERDTTLDGAVTIHPGSQPVYQVQLRLPVGMQLQHIGPEPFETSIRGSDDDGGRVLTVHLLDGRQSPFTITVLGRLPDPTSTNGSRQLNAPVLEVLEVTSQEGEIAILPDPDTDVILGSLQNCQGSAVAQGSNWLQANQRTLAKAVIRYRRPDYSAVLTLNPRTPQVSAQTISNVKLTPIAVEETILVRLRIAQAGIQTISMILPEAFREARVQAKLLKQKTVAPATDAAGQPIPGWIRLTLELQDYVRNEYVVLLEHDRLLATTVQRAQLPVIENAQVQQRYLAIENASRDEVTIDPAGISGLSPVGRQQQAWRELAAVLGNQVTQAYVSAENNTTDQLAFQIVERQEVEISGARIGLATTTLVVDQSGAYRGLVQFRVINSDEQFLEIQLPGEASLWTAVVAGEPVKPIESDRPQPGVVRLPLVKTAAGEGDFAVEIKYGGRMPVASGLAAVEFPLVRSTNINIELSQVRLFLPEGMRWIDFQGTMRLVEDERRMAAGFQSYMTKRIQDAVSVMNTSRNKYTKVRALVNLKQSKELLFDNLGQDAQRGYDYSDLARGNIRLLEEAEREAMQQLAETEAQGVDNRLKLLNYYSEQEISRSKNVVSDLASNFDALPAEQTAASDGNNFNSAWFSLNELQAKESGQKAAAQSRITRNIDLPAQDAPVAAKPGDQVTPEFATRSEQESLKKQVKDAELQDQIQVAGDEEQLERYQQQLEFNAARGRRTNVPQTRAATAVVGGGRTGEMAGEDAGAEPGGPIGGFAGGGGFGRQSDMDGAMPGAAGQWRGLAQQPGQQPGQGPGEGQSPLAEFGDLDQGFASLDITLPTRGRVFRFTTPRGETRIQARSLAWPVARRWPLAWPAIAAAVLVWLISRRRVQAAFGKLFGSLLVCLLLIAMGSIAMLAGAMVTGRPAVGALVLLVGVVLLLRVFMLRRQRRQPQTA